ncbi:uncharacterized protein LOC126788740 [Argentina anserina]|uniref:uncharacterized protein LOC126788740 n=1 Tax=Argentina anserina TaxID=57926 RepID=UPI0021763D50|nr:uncharacterized protein LOC126788740 [Potentilla anserina]
MNPKMSALSSSRLHLLKCSPTTLAYSTSSSKPSFRFQQKHPPSYPAITSASLPSRKCNAEKASVRCLDQEPSQVISMSEDGSGNEKLSSRFLIVGAVSVGVAMLLMGMDDQQKAMALGPEGPLMEEFWDNVRRYALYALTVSTGALYVVIQPIYELLKNPISAILVLVLLGGSFFILTQVVSAMIGDTDFNYQYQY